MKDEEKIEAISALTKYVHEVNSHLLGLEGTLTLIERDGISNKSLNRMKDLIKDIKCVGVNVRLDLIALFASHVTEERRNENGGTRETPL